MHELLPVSNQVKVSELDDRQISRSKADLADNIRDRTAGDPWSRLGKSSLGIACAVSFYVRSRMGELQTCGARVTIVVG
jgi:hypothetical protein